MTSILPLLYQSGYITIKDYDEDLDLYVLDIPNKEVRIGLMKSLLPQYVANKMPETTTMVAYLSRGRVDMVLRTKTTLYVMELKLDQSADKAMEQIDLKNYPERFALCGLPIVKVGISFDSERCTIGEWTIRFN